MKHRNNYRVHKSPQRRVSQFCSHNAAKTGYVTRQGAIEIQKLARGIDCLSTTTGTSRNRDWRRLVRGARYLQSSPEKKARPYISLKVQLRHKEKFENSQIFSLSYSLNNRIETTWLDPSRH